MTNEAYKKFLLKAGKDGPGVAMLLMNGVHKKNITCRHIMSEYVFSKRKDGPDALERALDMALKGVTLKVDDFRGAAEMILKQLNKNSNGKKTESTKD